MGTREALCLAREEPTHVRSGLIKAKFRDHVRSKGSDAMVNEVLCKIICHNICCLIQESHELGISLDELGDSQAENA